MRYIIGVLFGVALLLGSALSAQADSTYRSLQYGLDIIHAPTAWQYTQGAGSKTCIVDTGIDDIYTPDLKGRVIAGYNSINPKNPADYYDDQDHGTHVAGIIAGRGINITGVAPETKLIIAKVLAADGSGSAESVTAGIFFCISQHADVINMSLGGGSSPYDGMEIAIRAACRANIAIAVASGNDGGPHETHPATIVSKCLIAVNASDEKNRLTSFSNYGENVRTVTAPGSNIVSTWVGGSVAPASGTSMAAPFVAGTMALLRAQGLSATQTVAAILSTAKYPRGESVYHPAYGKGILDAGAAMVYGKRLLQSSLRNH